MAGDGVVEIAELFRGHGRSLRSGRRADLRGASG